MKFDTRYKVYLDITAQSTWAWDNDVDSTWVEVYPDINTFSRPLQTDELFHRFKWTEVVFRNMPYLSTELYNVLSELPITQEIRIKVVTDNNTIRGYFGNNDCDFDDDNKVIKVTPAVLDQYTEVLENYETKVDASGGVYNYTTTYEPSNTEKKFQYSHNLPIVIKSNNLDEARTPTADGIPNGSGSFIFNTKYEYNSKINIFIDATLYPVWVGTVSFYLRTYNVLNLLVSEEELDVFDSPTTQNSISISSSYSVDDFNIPKNNYVRLEAVISDPPSSIITYYPIEYGNVQMTVNSTSIPENTITVNVNMLSEDLVPNETWTEVKHGRASPKYTSWEDMNGVVDYFTDPTGEPTGLFEDTEFGTVAASGATFNNDKEVTDEPINGLTLGDLREALGEYGYEASSVTVYKGGFYRSGLTRKRRVFATCTFSRDEYFKTDEWEEGSLVPPQGEGWNTEPIEYEESGKRLWVRKPFNGIYSDDWTLGNVDTSGGTFAGDNWQEKLTSKIVYPTGDESRPFNTCRELREFIKTIYNGTSDLLVGKAVESTFFWNDNESDLRYYDTAENSGLNYVTQQENFLNRIACLHTYNLNTEVTTSSQSDSVLEVTFKDLMTELKNLFNVYWFLDDDETLHIEHISYLDLTQKSSDVRTNPLIDETLKFKYDKTLMFETVTYETVNSSYLDFTDNTMSFDRIASNKRNQDLSNIIATEVFTTDLKHCMENPNDLDNGVILIAYDENNDSINSTVQIANREFENGELALSTLLIKYWRYEGVWSSGKINTVDFEFQQTSRTKTGESISLKGVYDIDEDGDRILFVKTNIGIGLIKDMQIDLNRGTTSDIILLYRYDSSPEGDGFVLIAADDVYFDIGNYEN